MCQVKRPAEYGPKSGRTIISPSVYYTRENKIYNLMRFDFFGTTSFALIDRDQLALLRIKLLVFPDLTFMKCVPTHKMILGTFLFSLASIIL